MEAGGFLGRWSRKKAGLEGEAPIAPTAPLPTAPTDGAIAAPVVPIGGAVPFEARTEAAPELPTLDDVARLTHQSDYSRFVLPGVAPGVKNAALKKLFSDPHFNVMDGLDTYIDDYGKADPIPLSMLRKMNQSAVLGLFDHETSDDEGGQAAVAVACPDGVPSAPVAESGTGVPEPLPAPALEAAAAPGNDDNADLRLQQDDAARRPGSDPRPGP